MFILLRCRVFKVLLDITGGLSQHKLEKKQKKYFKAFCADKIEQNYIFVYLNDLIFGGLLCKLPDPINKLFVSCVVGFSSINHPDTQFHQLQRKAADVSVRGGNGEMKKCINNRNTSVNTN